MSISPEQVRHLAHLARLALSEAEVVPAQQQLNQIFSLIEEMGEVDVRGIEPMAHAQDLSQRLRDDRVTELDNRDVFQALAPEAEAGLYLVPKVIE